MASTQESGGTGEASAEHSPQNSSGRHGPYGQHSAEFFLSNYRLGRTLGIGSFGKVLDVAALIPVVYRGRLLKSFAV